MSRYGNEVRDVTTWKAAIVLKENKSTEADLSLTIISLVNG